MVAQHKMGIHVEGIVEILARNLYQDPDVFVRELIQNGHDAIVTRYGGGSRNAGAGPRIDITVNDARRTITFADNGCGMTEQDVHSFVSVVGASSKARNGSSLIGRFGIGLLSGFIVAERIDVVTAAAGARAVRWSSTGDGTYETGGAHRDDQGTTVTLTLRAEHAHYLDTDQLKRLVRWYADVIGVPIYVGGGVDPANAVHAPWHERAAGAAVPANAYETYWKGRFPGEVALDTMPVAEPITWPTPSGESCAAVVHGVLALTDRTRVSADKRGATDLFVRRMFVASGMRAILPDWASCVRGVIECDALETNAARDGVLPTPAFHAMRQAVSRAILARLTWLAREEPTRLQDVLRWHALPVLSACLREENSDFFAAVAELIPLESNRGLTTLRSYLKTAERSEDGQLQIHYVMQAESAAQFTALAAANGHHVIYADRDAVEPLLARLRDLRGDIELVCLDVDVRDLFAPVDDATAIAFAGIVDYIRELSAGDVKLSTFIPHDVPIAVHRTPEAERCERYRHLAADPAAPHHIREALRSLFEDRQDEKSVHVNAANPVLQTIASRTAPLTPLERQALSALHHMALLTHTRSGNVDTVARASAEQQRLVMMVLGDSRLAHTNPHSCGAQEGIA